MEYTLELLEKRHSVRSYSSESISAELRNALLAEVTMINTHESGLNFQLVFDNDDPFKGFMRSYGFFRNARNYLACVIDPTFPNTEERAGFFAEQFVMKAVSLGLGTCFIGGTFSREHVDASMHVYEDLPFIVAFGFESQKGSSVISKFATKMIHRNQLGARDFFEGDDNNYKEATEKFPWLPKSLEALACAPSSLNKQPVRVFIGDDGMIHARSLPATPKSAIDLGIGKFNFVAVAPGIWDWGEKAPFYPDEDC